MLNYMTIEKEIAMINFDSDFNKVYEELSAINEEALKTWRVSYYEDGVKRSFTVQASSKAEAERIGWSKVDADSLYVSEVINEANFGRGIWNSNPSSEFWYFARNKQISTSWFHRAFDEELTELGLMDIFDDNGMLKNKGVWGRIKPVKEANPDSWAIKALVKMWSLQFKEGVTKSMEQVRQEDEQAKRAERQAALAAKEEKARTEREAKYEAAKADWETLKEKLPSVQTLINNLAEEFAAEKKAILIKDLETAVKLKEEARAVTRGIINFYDATEMYLTGLKSTNGTINISVTLDEPDIRLPSTRIFVSVKDFFGMGPAYVLGDKHAKYYTGFGAANSDEETIKTEILSMLNDIWDVVSRKMNSLKEIQDQYNRIMQKANAAKAAQAAVDAGKPANPNFVSNLLSIFEKGREAAKQAANFYSNTTDGSEGAAYADKEYSTIVAVGTYLLHCNWRAIVNDKEIAAWRKTDDIDALADELEKVFDAFCPELVIEIIK